MLALEGIKVIDMGIWAFGPIAAAVLGDWGADVIKIEDTVGGDPLRGLDTMNGTLPPRKYSLYDLVNRNKRSVALDLKQEAGKNIVYKMVKDADVFVTNYRAPALKRMGMDYESLSQINPRLVYAFCSGYGEEGPEKDKAGFDVGAYWTRGGFLAQLGEREGPPVRPTYAGLGDQPSGLHIAGGIALALYVRERTGLGQKVSSSLLHSALWAVSCNAQMAMEIGAVPRGKREEAVNPLNNSYQTKDGKWLYLLMLQADRFWAEFCRLLGLEHLIDDPKFNSMATRVQTCKELIAILDGVFITRTRDEWAKTFEGTSIMWDPANTFEELTRDPQLLVNGGFIPFEHPTKGSIKVIASPIKLSKTPPSIRRHAPECGEHTEAVLLEMGYTWEDITQLKESKVIP